MKKLFFLFIFVILSFVIGQAQTTYPTNREVYNFSVGDTFIYQFYNDPSCYNCFFEYYVVVTGKSFSSDSNTILYRYLSDALGTYPFDTSYTDLDSPVILPPYPSDSFGLLDTAFIDSSTFCVPRFVALSETVRTLSAFYSEKWASGLGIVEDAFQADLGSPDYNDHTLTLIYYHKDSIVCGAFNPAWLVSSINETNTNAQLKLYPNPVEDVLHVDGPIQNQEYFIYDATGRICSSGLYQNDISVQNLASGIYFIKITVNGEESFDNFIKK